jgi:hypothetical protein
MDIEKQVFSIFSSFIRDLSKTFPEIKNCLYRNYETEIVGENLKLEDCLKIKSFLSIVNEHSKLIENKDIKFFENDNILEEISFQRLWEKNISDKTKATIWKYFQTFTIININLNSSKQLQEVLTSMNNGEITKEDIKDKQTAKDLKKLKKLTEDVKEEVNDEDELDLDNMLGGLMDSNIGSIAKEVASGMKLDEMFGNIDENTNPMEVMAQMMNPEKMGNIFQNINNVMEKKMKSGELNEETLKKEAQSMYGDMANNPLFGNLMKQMNPDSPVPASNVPSGPSDSSVSSESKDTKDTKELSKEEKKEKLKKKIEAKKKERTK